VIYAVALDSGVIGSFGGPVLGRFGSALVLRSALSSALALGSVLSFADRIGGVALSSVLFVINAVPYLAAILPC
jgi:hypothetical protein